MICGIDEAGRGPLAGPVYAAAVVLPDDFPLEVLNDSKKLSPAKRASAEKLIKAHANFGIGFASHKEIDTINIAQASLLAMARAFADLRKKYPQLCIEAVIVDGLYTPMISAKSSAVVKADTIIPAVMAASILAKQERDRVMVEYSQLYPNYAYEKHKGYPTKLHRELIAKFGPSPIQRRTFRT